MSKPWRHILLTGLTLLPAGTQTRRDSPAHSQTDLPKTVYVGATPNNAHQSTADKQRLHQFLNALRQMPNLKITPIPESPSGDSRSRFYPEDAVIGLPGGAFTSAAPNIAPGASNHGNASDLFKILKQDGYAIHTNLGIDIDGGDILYDATRGIFLIGGTTADAAARAAAFTGATGHYAIPVVMTQPYANYIIPAASGLPHNPARFYHLDTFASILPNGELLLYPDATDSTTLRQLKTLYGSSYIPLGAEDADRYASNMVSSIDATGTAHLLLPSVSHQLPFPDHIPLHKTLSARGYIVHSPEQQGYHEPHPYRLNLFDKTGDFLPSLQQFVDRLANTATTPDIATLSAWAEQSCLQLAPDGDLLILRGTQGNLCALPLKPTQPIGEAECKTLTNLQQMLHLNQAYRAGASSRTTIARAVYPEASAEDIELAAAYDELPYTILPNTKNKATPYIFESGGPECMTLEVLKGPSPQQKITALLHTQPTNSTKAQAHAIAQSAGFKLRFQATTFQIQYPTGATQTFEYGKPFEQNTLQIPQHTPAR